MSSRKFEEEAAGPNENIDEEERDVPSTMDIDEEEVLEPVVRPYVSGVLAAKLSMPKLKSINSAYEWMEDLRRFTSLAERTTPMSDLAEKVILMIEPKEDASLMDFKNLIRKFRKPGRILDSTKKNVYDEILREMRQRTPEELLAAVTSAAFQGLARVGKRVGESYVEVERPEMVWEWVKAFVTCVYLDPARVNLYKDVLESTLLVLPPIKDGLPAMNEALNAHIQKLTTLLQFSKTSGVTAKKRALLRTLRVDQAMSRESARGATWEEILQHVRGELDSRVSAHQMGYQPSVQGLQAGTSSSTAKGLTTAEKEEAIRMHVSALDGMGVDTKKFTIPKTYGTTARKPESRKDYGDRKKYDKRDQGSSSSNRQQPYRREDRRDDRRDNRRDERRDNNNGRKDTKKDEKTCFWCKLPGHFERNCQSKLGGRSQY